MKTLAKSGRGTYLFSSASHALISVAAIALAGYISVASVPASAADRIDVILDQAKVLQLPPATATVIVGNPLIADVTMINRNTQLILTGKSFGQTNMIALDAKGNSVGESNVVVRAPSHGLVVQRGMVQETYSCQPRCQPTVTLGDDNKFAGQALTAARARATASAGSGAAK
ncbi:MAG: pilus assembly protein N-terminal domain-containing protein [Beijerinckiaceae bacterium]